MMAAADDSRQPGKGINNISTQTAPAVDRQINKAWFFAVLALAVFSGLSAVYIVPPLLVDIASEMDISVAVAGQLSTATFAAWAVSLVTVGPLSDSFGRRPVALTGLLVLSGSVIASAFAPNIQVLLALRVLTGLAGGTLPPTSVGVVSDVISPGRRAQAVTALLALNGLASAITVPIVAVLADWGGWRVPFMVAGLLLAIALLSNWVWFPRDSRERVRRWVFFSRYRSLLSLRFFRVAVAVGLTQRIAFWGTISFFPAYLIHTYGISVGFVALPLVITATGQVIGGYSAAFVAKRKYRAALLAGTSVVGGVCGFLFFSLNIDLWVSVAVATVGTGLLSVTMPALVAVSTEYSGESKSSGASIMGISNQSGGALGAAIAGAMLANAGYGGIGYMCLGATMVSALMTSLFGRQFGERAGQTAGT